MHRYHDLLIWQRGRDLCTQIYQTTRLLPKEEKFGLVSQMRRAAVSIPSNIAEGSSRSSNLEFQRFLEISLGSAYELETQLLISRELDLLPEDNVNTLLNELSSMIKMTAKLRANLLTK